MANSQEKRFTGSVKWYNLAKGFGFIIPDAGGKDVFVHATDVKNSNINPEDLTEGAKISYTLKEARGKTSATDLIIE